MVFHNIDDAKCELRGMSIFPHQKTSYVCFEMGCTTVSASIDGHICIYIYCSVYHPSYYIIKQKVVNNNKPSTKNMVFVHCAIYESIVVHSGCKSSKWPSREGFIPFLWVPVVSTEIGKHIAEFNAKPCW